ncbi:MAG: DegT/DnrJ/EryC1/StrS aminotransferase, partial [Thermoprotei archaeon]
MPDKPAILGGEPVRTKPLGEWPIVTDEEIEAVTRVLKRRKLCATMYSAYEVPELEEEFARAMNVKYAVATSSGTAALDIAVAALGIGPGDEVITTPYTFIATATCIVHNCAIPVFADVDLRTRNIDPSDIERKITDRTKAIIVVHIAGHPCEMDEIMEIAE